jgi:hypothetical protein
MVKIIEKEFRLEGQSDAFCRGESPRSLQDATLNKFLVDRFSGGVSRKLDKSMGSTALVPRSTPYKALPAPRHLCIIYSPSNTFWTSKVRFCVQVVFSSARERFHPDHQGAARFNINHPLIDGQRAALIRCDLAPPNHPV